MKKAAAGLCLAVSIAVSSFAGSAAAATPLEQSVDALIGTKYKYGGTTTKGFDCSGFTQFVFSKFNVELSRVSSAQAKQGEKVARSDLRTGDLVFFNTSGKGISHVGIYLGDGEFAHSSSKYGVKISKLSEKYYAKRYVTARRVLDNEVYTKVAVAAEETVKQETNQSYVMDAVAMATEQAELMAEEAELLLDIDEDEDVDGVGIFPEAEAELKQ